MALQPFNYYFHSGAGSITVNGSAPLSQYEEGTPLTIDVTFSDGSTTVEWIVNNVSAGTTDPLVINMPSGGIYLRILGSGAPPVTNKFRFFWRFANGIGSLTVNGGVAESYYEAGTSLEIETVLVPGFTFTDFNINNGLIVGGTNPYTFNMPSQDIDITINATGIPEYTDNHGLRYYAEFCDLTGQSIDLEILQEGYEGEAEKRTCAGVTYSWGDFGANVLDVLVYSSIKFSLIGTRDEFFPLLDGGNRYWKVRLKIEGALFWEGYLSNSILGVNEVAYEQAQMFTAVDGLKSLDAIRAIDSYFTRLSSGFEMMKAIVRCMNQTFDNARTSHVGCSIYETRLDRDRGLFEQLITPDNAVYEDGETPVFMTSGGVELNTSLYISEVLERCLKPFMCRLFLWKNEFYIISTPEFNKPTYTQFDYDTFGEADGSTEIDSGLDLSCKFTNGQRTGKPVYTEFTTTLKLGVLDNAARGGMIEYDFQTADWILLGSGPYSGTYQLSNWKYVNARPSNQPSSYPGEGSLALVQFVGSGSFGAYCKIWGTSSPSGITDPALSWIEIDTYRNKNPIQVAQGIANTLAFSIEFMTIDRTSNNIIPVDHYFGAQIQIGDSYLDWDGNQTFSWTSSETIILFPMTNIYSWNIVDVLPIEIPEDGIVTVRIYETICDGQPADKYSVGIRNMSLKIEENEAFVLEDIPDKFITTNQYSNVYPPVDLYIGDVRSDNSSSAIKLNIPEYNYPPSSLWSIDSETEIRLTQVFLQELANVYGQPNPRLVAIALRDGVNPLEVVPYQNVIYDNAYWMVMAIDLDFQLNTWRIELHRLGEIES